MQAFRPTGPTIEIVVGVSAATQLVGGADVVRLEAPASGTVYVAFGTSGGAVTVDNGMGLLAGSVETLGVPYGSTHILTVGAGTLRVTPGLGM